MISMTKVFNPRYYTANRIKRNKMKKIKTRKQLSKVNEVKVAKLAEKKYRKQFRVAYKCYEDSFSEKVLSVVKNNVIFDILGDQQRISVKHDGDNILTLIIEPKKFIKESNIEPIIGWQGLLSGMAKLESKKKHVFEQSYKLFESKLEFYEYQYSTDISVANNRLKFLKLIQANKYEISKKIIAAINNIRKLNSKVEFDFSELESEALSYIMEVELPQKTTTKTKRNKI